MKKNDNVRLKKKCRGIIPGTSGVIVEPISDNRFRVKLLHDQFGEKLEPARTISANTEHLEKGGPLNLISVSDAVDKYNLSPSTVYDYLKKEKIIGRKKNNKWEIIEQSLKEMET